MCADFGHWYEDHFDDNDVEQETSCQTLPVATPKAVTKHRTVTDSEAFWFMVCVMLIVLCSLIAVCLAISAFPK